MRKTICVSLILIILIMLFSGCGANPSTADETAMSVVQETEVVSADLAEIRTTIIDTLGVSDPLMLDSSVLLELYGIGEDMIRQSGCFVTMSGTFPDEVILVEAIDPAAASVIAEKLQSRLDEVMVQSKTYDAENYAAAQQCLVTKKGTYVTLILSPRQAEIAEICQMIMD